MVEFINLRCNLSHSTLNVRSRDKLGNVSGKCGRGMHGKGSDNIVWAPQLYKTLDDTVHRPDKLTTTRVLVPTLSAVT
jgi:hypothetical protein